MNLKLHLITDQSVITLKAYNTFIFLIGTNNVYLYILISFASVVAKGFVASVEGLDPAAEREED